LADRFKTDGIAGLQRLQLPRGGRGLSLEL
jgi:hypothetical protein